MHWLDERTTLAACLSRAQKCVVCRPHIDTHAPGSSRYSRCCGHSVSLSPTMHWLTTLCWAGYYCPPGTGSPSLQCDLPTSYCPTGSALPVNTSAGYFAVAIAGGLFVNQSQCSAGRYCQGGVSYPCPAGRYGTATGETNEQCIGNCTQGYYCPPGSASPTQEECGAADVVCPSVRCQRMRWLCQR